MIETTVSLLGLFAGSIGLCISLSLAFIVKRDVDWRHTGTFFCVGSYLMMTHTAPVTNNDIISIALSAVMLVVAIIAEIGGFIWVLRNTPDNAKTSERAEAEKL